MNKRVILSFIFYGVILAGCLLMLHFFTQITEIRPLETVIEETKGEKETIKIVQERTETDSDIKPEESASLENNFEPKTEKTQQKKTTGKKKKSQAVVSLEEPKPKENYKIVFASDLHYLDPKTHDDGEAFRQTMAEDDGKILTYSSEIIDAFLDEMRKEKPDAVVLGGDLTFNGEKISHQGLVEKLKRLDDDGIKVIVIPGNHDIRNYHGMIFSGKEKIPAYTIEPEEFYDLYHQFGYAQAISRDKASLSYVYAIDDKNWLLMLDSCIYEPDNQVEGRIKDETYVWMEEQLKTAKENGIRVIPSAHHNLLGESRLYVTQCTMADNKRLVNILQKYDVSVFLSGHLHLKRIKKYEAEPGVKKDAFGITEIVSSALTVAPCQYTVIEWKQGRELFAESREIDVESWARENRIDNKDLLNFSEYSRCFYINTISEQIYQYLGALPEDQKTLMAQFYANILMQYGQGVKTDIKSDETAIKAYNLWVRNLPDSKYFKELGNMIKDTKTDHMMWEEPSLLYDQKEKEVDSGEKGFDEVSSGSSNEGMHEGDTGR